MHILPKSSLQLSRAYELTLLRQRNEFQQLVKGTLHATGYAADSPVAVLVLDRMHEVIYHLQLAEYYSQKLRFVYDMSLCDVALNLVITSEAEVRRGMRRVLGSQGSCLGSELACLPAIV